MGDFLIISGLITAIVCSIGGYFTLAGTKRGALGAVLGLVLGPIGLATAWGLRLRARHDADEEGPITPIAELERLAALKERGHLTEEEFNARKRLLLGISRPESPVAVPPARLGAKSLER